MTDDVFFRSVGRLMCVLALAFCAICATAFLVLALEALDASENHPTFTIAPDSTPHPKAK